MKKASPVQKINPVLVASAALVRKAVTDAGQSARTLSKATGISPSHLARIMRGVCPMNEMARSKIAAALRVEPDALGASQARRERVSLEEKARPAPVVIVAADVYTIVSVELKPHGVEVGLCLGDFGEEPVSITLDELDERLLGDGALEVLLGEGGSLVGAVVLLPQQRDGLVVAQRVG